MKVIKSLIVIVLLAGCTMSPKERAKSKATELGMKNAQCINVDTGDGGTDVAFCTEGRQLIICGDSCLYVNLDPEHK